MDVTDRFKKHFGKIVRYGLEKAMDKAGDKEEAFSKASVLAFPKTSRKYIVVDLDYEEAGASWMDQGLPHPTIICANPQNGHAHLLWELKKEVYWKDEQKEQTKAYRFFRDVQRGFQHALDGDPGYTGTGVKNPFSEKWVTYWYDFQYELTELADYVKIPKQYWHKKDHDWIFIGRNCELFYHTRNYGYRKVKVFDSFQSLKSDIGDFCANYNKVIIPMKWPERGPLGIGEVTTMVERVAKWIWDHRNDESMKQRCKNVGALKLEPMNYDGNEENFLNEVKRRQSEGAKYVNTIRRTKTEELIKEAVAKLKQDSLPLKAMYIADLTGLDYSTVNKNKSTIHFYDYFI